MDEDERSVWAREIVKNWIELADLAPYERRVWIDEALIGEPTQAVTIADKLHERLLVPRVEDSIVRVMKLLAIDYPDAAEQVTPMLLPRRGVAHQPALLAEIASKVVGRRDWHDTFIQDLDPWHETLTARLDEFINVASYFIWHEEVAPVVQTSHPALPVEVVRPLAKLLSGSCRFPAFGNGSWRVVMGGNDEIGVIRHDSVVGKTRRTKYVEFLSPKAFEVLGTRHAHLLVRELVARGWEAMRRKSSEPERIVIREGWSSLFKDLNIKGGHGQHQLRLAAHVLGLVDLRPGSGTPAPLLRVKSLSASAVGTPAVEVHLLNDLRPGRVTQMRRDSDRSLVPLPCHLPPVDGTKLMARAYSYQMLLLFEMRRRAAEFDRERFISIPTVKRRHYAADVGLSDRNRAAVEDGWTAAGAEQFLETAGGDRFRLGQAYQSVDSFLRDAAKRSAEGKRRRQRASRASGS